jgi:nitrite reductase/ring-hydroxylating ferredoxin subunit
MNEAADVGPAEGLMEDGSWRVAVIGGREVAIIRWRGELFAFRNICPHQGAPLCGDLAPRLESAGPGSVNSIRSVPIVQCTRHRWEFDVRTGKALYDPKLRVKTYPVREENSRVFIEI